MTFDEVRRAVEGVPFLAPSEARKLYHFVLEHRPERVLELGFAHGVSSCYVAAALDEIGDGHLTSVDLEAAREWQEPSIEELLERTGLSSRVTVVREKSSYTWYLKKAIEERSDEGGVCEPIYDFAFVDGAKNWTIDGLAFFLVDKLLRPGGWILFDDLRWTYASTGRRATDGIVHRELGPDERSTPHIEAVFRLLVMQHPGYGDFRIEDGWWGWARKLDASETRDPAPRRLVVESSWSLPAVGLRAKRALGAPARRLWGALKERLNR